MFRRFNCLCAIAMVLAWSSTLFAQHVDREGKAWLSRNSDAATVNVDGAWQGKDWGRVVLTQAQGSRDVTGKGDGWIITGVVSGSKTFLLFSDKGRVNYSAELTLQSGGTLVGSYARGLMDAKSKTKPMTLAK
ncbi:MAG: hypothetical protein M1570_12440 [Chloroflexi bacterium]|nr:hypothetical protein [Chloroflexota bacterium]